MMMNFQRAFFFVRSGLDLKPAYQVNAQKRMSKIISNIFDSLFISHIREEGFESLNSPVVLYFMWVQPVVQHFIRFVDPLLVVNVL